jgi:type VI secretion system protein ImpH
MRGTTDRLSYFRRLEAEPYRFDFFQAMRRIECLHADQPRLGAGLRPAAEPLRLGQEPAMDFAPAAISALRTGKEGRPPRLEVRFFGLFGPNGPLPLHLTDYARERIIHADDQTFARFADMFHHRLLLLFYRAWAQAQPTVSLDRPAADRFAAFVGSLIGIGTDPLRERDEVADHAKLYYSGLLVRQIRNADGLQALLSGYFRLPFRVEQFVGHWMTLPTLDRTRLGRHEAGAQLGVGAVLGRRVWDRQHKIRLWLGPLGLQEYESFLPGGDAMPRLVALLRQYLCCELEWDAQLILRAAAVPTMQLGRICRLGWTSWLGGRRSQRDADDLRLDPERLVASAPGMAGSPPIDLAATAANA